MVYDRLNSAVDSLALGNGTVYNFINYIGRIHLTGGIARYTLNRGYFFNNISSNFEGGLSGRYGYGTDYYGNLDVKNKVEGNIGKYVRGNAIENSTLMQDRVGDFYTISGPLGNSEKPFTTIEEFSLLGSTIREEENLIYNSIPYAFQDRYSAEGNDSKFYPHPDHPILPRTEIGDDVANSVSKVIHLGQFNNRLELKESPVTKRTRDMLAAYRQEVTDSQGIGQEEINTYKHEEAKADGIVSSSYDVTLKRNARTERLSLLKFGEFERMDKYFKFRIPNRTLGLTSEVSEVFEKFNEYYVKGDGDLRGNNVSIPSTGNISVLDFYEDIRNEYGYKNGKKNLFWFGKSYASPTNEDVEIYKFGLGKAPNKASIDPTFRRGSFRTNSSKNDANYSYYQENDKGSPVTQFNAANTQEGFTPSIDTFNRTSRLMKKVNEKFYSNDIKSLVNRFHTSINADEVSEDDQLISAYDPKYGLSRGRNLLKATHDNDDITGFNNPYCRVWTAHYQYSKMKDRIRPFMQGETFMSIKELQSNLGKLRPEGGAQRLNDNSVLMDSGFVKITPFNKDGKLMGGRDSIKKYMFSIENLAWKNFATKDRLSDEQRGVYGGRIMWFPPYNLKFNENISTNWKDHDFIGRGEKIYTYINTDRAGTLDFSILVDHPSILNKAINMGDSDVTDEDILRFFAGCGTLESASNDEEDKNNNGEPDNGGDEPDTTPEERPDNQYISVNYIMFYPNNFSAKNYYNNLGEIVNKIDEYEMNNDANAFVEMDVDWAKQKLKPMNYDNMSKYHLNSGDWSDSTKERMCALLPIDNLDDYHPYVQFKNLAHDFSQINDAGSTTIFGYDTRDYELDSVVVRGFASDHGYEEANNILSNNRATTIAKLAKYFCDGIDNDKITTGACLTIPVEEEDGVEDVNGLDAKIARSAIITFNIKLREDVVPSADNPNTNARLAVDGTGVDEETEGDEGTVSNDDKNEIVVTTSTFHGGEDEGHYNYTYQNEFMYFKSIEASNPLEYKRIVDKVKFFNPAFHSITPEGFNARLNFLQQCTRQGPTIGSHSGDENTDTSNMSSQAGNMSFGMAPYCILRIGDFYYSKIVIDSISINYDTDGKVQYDLNPEGIGVQPMMANISMNFHFIGGQDIEGPVQQLQNALSFNYYANSSIYTPETQAPMAEVINDKID